MFFQLLAGVGVRLIFKEHLQTALFPVGLHMAAVKLPAHIDGFLCAGQAFDPLADTAGGVLFAKVLNLFTKHKVNPMIGAAGISAFPMSARVIHKMGQQEDRQNFLLMHAAGANVAGQIASVVAGGIILNFFG